mgnify:CR=1 FL=1
MGNFVEKSRSNYFRVTNVEEFQRLCKENGLQPLSGETPLKRGEVGFILADGKEVQGRSIHEFKHDLAALLDHGEICVVRTITYDEDSVDEIQGRTIAIRKGQQELLVDLNDIYHLINAKWHLDTSPTEEE